MRFFSPAKINLFFRIIKRRLDGYHEIVSLVQVIDLCDELVLLPSHCDRLTCSDPHLPCDASNLVQKALTIFRSNYEFPSVHLHLEKRIPMQSGLGGGSSNAATALYALNEYAGRPASLADLMRMGAQLGSDVCLFFSLGSAYCTGRGEQCESVQMPPLTGYLACPAFGLSTPQVYRETKISELQDSSHLRESISNPVYFNDLEQTSFRLEPRLITVRDQLRSRGFSTVVMTGSGSAFFCLGGHNPDTKGLIPFHSLTRSSDRWYDQISY